jgi:hypothetical protein
MTKESTRDFRRAGRLGLLASAALLLPLLSFFVGRVSTASAGRGGGSPAPAPAAPHAASAPWTAVGSTGVVEPGSATVYGVNNAALGFRTTNNGGEVFARYNVTNTFDNNANPGAPGWTTLEVGSNAPAGTYVHTRLYRVNACDGRLTEICLTKNEGLGGPRCDACQFPAGSVDFSSGLYYVYVYINRTSNMLAMPQVFTLRLR